MMGLGIAWWDGWTNDCFMIAMHRSESRISFLSQFRFARDCVT
jgi:hypothetical protein